MHSEHSGVGKTGVRSARSERKQLLNGRGLGAVLRAQRDERAKARARTGVSLGVREQVRAAPRLRADARVGAIVEREPFSQRAR